MLDSVWVSPRLVTRDGLPASRPPLEERGASRESRRCKALGVTVAICKAISLQYQEPPSF
jgi:hypothetical protein